MGNHPFLFQYTGSGKDATEENRKRAEEAL